MIKVEEHKERQSVINITVNRCHTRGIKPLQSFISPSTLHSYPISRLKSTLTFSFTTLLLYLTHPAISRSYSPIRSRVEPNAAPEHRQFYLTVNAISRPKRQGVSSTYSTSITHTKELPRSPEYIFLLPNSLALNPPAVPHLSPHKFISVVRMFFFT